MTVIVMCPECGPVAAVPLDDPDDWNAGVLWGYIALKDHRRDVHGEVSA